jgi:two-component system CheB/CheR fusion protein
MQRPSNKTTGVGRPKRVAAARRRPGDAAVDFPVVAIGASAGGLEACSLLLDAMRDAGDTAFILVLHLDPTHESLMVDLLAAHTSLTVLQAKDGMPVQRGHFYIIPPAYFLAMGGGVLHLTPSPANQGARLPFDFLLQSMSRECGGAAICVVLSGTGADGSVGLLAVKREGGFVIAQEPSEADYDGMPRSAIATGAVDIVLKLADIPSAIIQRQRTPRAEKAHTAQVPDRLPEIIEMLRVRTAHDFTLYKPGTLKRRVERRMAMAAIGANEMEKYVEILGRDPVEVEQLAKDLLIHVTGFFRDPAVFDILTKTIVSELIRDRQANHAVRIWVPGCSTGEEAYSLAMVFQEQIAAANSTLKLQIFASDADADAVAFARSGLYPPKIAADISPERLAAFFIKDEQGYKVLPELRAVVVFTVHDLLTDPPFSRIDLISCRNVMIYLGSEAQRKVVALFHFALRKGGILLLGNAEGVGDALDRFEVISKPARLYRHIGRSIPGAVDFAGGANLRARGPLAQAGPVAPSRQAARAEFCRSHAILTHAPATVLTNRNRECLFSLGPTERYLRMAPGHATLDVLAMVRRDLRARLRSAILRAIQDQAPVVVAGGRTGDDGHGIAFNIEVHPVQNDGEDLLLLYFVDQPAPSISKPLSPSESPFLASRVAELERDLQTAQLELQGALRSLEISGDEQKAINENALSANEEFQSTNEELLTSKEELQSLNEELTALNSQLQETLEQQRTTSNDLQNVLYSTDVATLFLDSELKIRFFTPATLSLFNIIKTDIGRPLQDLHSLAADAALPGEAREVLQTLAAIEREITTPDGVWCRRILPYRTRDHAVEGVVITFTDITQRRHAAQALEVAKRDAELANAAKSRFLAAASHDLRQPLQTLALLQGLLATRVEGTASERLVAGLDDIVGAMSAMLNTLLDINQIEAGIVRADIVRFGIDDLLDRLRDNFTYHAQAQGIGFRVMPCGLMVNSDPRLLEQILRNLVSNAIKYTRNGRVLLGCRRQAGMLRIEVWDTGIGIPDGELRAIFEEYHQLDNTARERNRGLGLGLSIVQRLAALLDHTVRVRSRAGIGSVFSIEIPIASAEAVALPPDPAAALPARHDPRAMADGRHRISRILVVEDDPDVREFLALALSDDFHHADAACDGPAALKLAAARAPDLLLTDYNLPGGMDGLEVARRLRDAMGPGLPVIILTGDTSTETLSAIAAQGCLQLNKPVKPAELKRAIRDLLPRPAPVAASPLGGAKPSVSGAAPLVIFIVDDDRNIRDLVRSVLEADGQTVRDFESGEMFLNAYRPGSAGCLLLDAYLPGIGGLDLLLHLRAEGDLLPTIMITGSSDVPMAVAAMRAGAADFIEKPLASADLLASVWRALEQFRDSAKLIAWQNSAAERIRGLTPRQREIMDLVLAGHASKNIAADLGISQRTVENHRAFIMKTTGTKSLPALARLALAAAGSMKSKPKRGDARGA